MLHWQEGALVRVVVGLDTACKTAFAAACAQRILPLYGRFAEQSVSASADELAALVGRIWTVLGGAEDDGLVAAQNRAEELVPDDSDGDWIFESGYAQHVAAAVAYAVRAWLTGDAREAVWAARQVYDVAEYAAQGLAGDGDRRRAPGGDVGDSQLVQQALSGIAEDLGSVQAGPSGFWALRARADMAGRVWSTSFP